MPLTKYHHPEVPREPLVFTVSGEDYSSRICQWVRWTPLVDPDLSTQSSSKGAFHGEGTVRPVRNSIVDDTLPISLLEDFKAFIGISVFSEDIHKTFHTLHNNGRHLKSQCHNVSVVLRAHDHWVR